MLFKSKYFSIHPALVLEEIKKEAEKNNLLLDELQLEYYKQRLADPQPMFKKGFGISTYAEGFLEDLFLDTLKFGERNFIVEVLMDEFGGKPFWKIKNEIKLDVDKDNIISVEKLIEKVKQLTNGKFDGFLISASIHFIPNFEKYTYFLRWDMERIDDLFKKLVYTFPAEEKDCLVKTQFYIRSNKDGILIKYLEA